MLASPELYPLVLVWLQALGLTPHATAQAALAHLLTALLLSQSVRPSALMRALLSPSAAPARQRSKRLSRAWARPWLSPARLTPCLVRAAVALVGPSAGPGPTAGLSFLVLDGVRGGAWHRYTLGLAWHGRRLPLAWAALPHPLPRGRFTPTVCALVRQVAAAWPDDRPAHLLADREFASRPLFRTLQEAHWGWTVRLRASSWVTIGSGRHWVRTLLVGAPDGSWSATAAAYATGAAAIAGTLVIGRGLAVVPAHQCGPASLAVRARQWGRRAQHVRSRHGRQRPPDASAATDRWVVLFTTHADWQAADASSRRRWTIEGTFRDAQGGWDGQHGWDLEPVVGRQATAATVEALAGLWALGVLVQSWVGDRARATTTPRTSGGVVAGWTTTGRLSVWARGRLALTEPSGRLRPWLRATLRAGAQRIATAGRTTPATAPPPPRARAA